MAEPYLSKLEIIVEQECRSLSQTGSIYCKHFFSGAAAYVDDQIFMTLSPAGLALKLPEEDRATLIRLGAKPLRHFPNAPVKKDYALLPIERIDDFGALGDLIARSISIVQTR